MEMVFAYALFAFSAAGSASTPTGEVEEIYTDLDLSFQREDVEPFGRSENDDFSRDPDKAVGYVTAVQGSRAWEEVKRRLGTVDSRNDAWSSSTSEEEALVADPESLSDANLAALWTSCHDGIKCAAVDRLLALRPMTLARRPGAGLADDVRRAIAAVTRVVARYTNPCDDRKAYADVTGVDDAAAVRRSMTVILRDNAALCGTLRAGEDLKDRTVWPGATYTRQRRTKTAKPTPPAGSKRPRIEFAPGAGVRAFARHVRVVAQPEAVGGSPATAAPGPHSSTGDRDESTAGGRGGSTGRDPGGPEAVPEAPINPEDGTKNAVTVVNGGCRAGGESRDDYADVDVVDAGAGDADTVREGYVEDGVLNNGTMDVYATGSGVRNKGVVDGSDAANGIVTVGTFNGGPADRTRPSDKAVGRATTTTVARTDDDDDGRQFAAVDLDNDFAMVRAGFIG